MVTRDWQNKLDLSDKIFLFSLAVVFFGVFLHAPLIVVLGNIWPNMAEPIKAWKELTLLVALTSAIFILWRQKKWQILNNWLMWLVLVYSLLGVVMSFALFKGIHPTIAGLMIDYRYILAFGLFYFAGQLYPKTRPYLVKLGIIGFLIVVVFGVLQVFVLPYDFLKYLGYDKALNIAPYLTVDENYDFIRINSTLRGPNVVGAMMVIGLAASASYLLSFRDKLAKSPKLLAVIWAFIAGSMVVLWFSYSRSALVASLLAVLIAVALYFGKKIKTKHLLGFFVVVFVLGAGLFMVKDSTFISNVLLHEDPNEAGLINSNDGHADSLVEGAGLMLRQPLGAGIGSTGSASLLTESPIIIENQYLFVAHELGWLGLGLFLAIFLGIIYILWKTWLKKPDWLVLAILSSGIGLAAIGLLLPVWADDTVSVIWWSLAGFIIGQYGVIKLKGSKNG